MHTKIEMFKLFMKLSSHKEIMQRQRGPVICEGSFFNLYIPPCLHRKNSLKIFSRKDKGVTCTYLQCDSALSLVKLPQYMQSTTRLKLQLT